MKSIRRITDWLIVTIDKTLSAGAKKQILFLIYAILFFLSVFVLIELILDIDASISDSNRNNIISNVYYHFADPGNQYAVKGYKNQIFVFFVSFVGSMLMSGVLISTISNIIDRRVDKCRTGQITYSFKDHIVIIGYNKMAIGLIKQLYKRELVARKGKASEKNPYWVILQTVSDVQHVRHELLSQLDKQLDKRIIIVHGGRDSNEDLSKLKLRTCNEIYLLGEENEYDHDSLNIESLKVVNMILSGSAISEKKDCHVLFENQSTFAVFQKQDIETKEHLNFIPFNFYERWAEKVLVRGEYTTRHENEDNISYPPIDRVMMTLDSDGYIHFVIFGMTSMGIAMGIEVAHTAHYPNFITKGKRTRITFIDSNARRELDYLLGCYYSLFDQCDYTYIDLDDNQNNFSNPNKSPKFTDIEFEIIQGHAESPTIQSMLKEWSNSDDRQLLTIAVCFKSPQQSIATALYMPPQIYDNKTTILVRQNISCATLELLKKAERYSHIYAFGMLNECYDIDSCNLRQAKHVNYIYDKIKPESEKLTQFDESECDRLWDALSTPHKWSNRYNANSIPSKKRCLGNNPSLLENKNTLELMAMTEHNRWNIEKLIIGYRPATKAEEKMVENRQITKNNLEKQYLAHLYIKPYEELPERVKGYDRMITTYLWKI